MRAFGIALALGTVSVMWPATARADAIRAQAGAATCTLDYTIYTPAGEWQSLEAIVVGNRLTATANGKRIHDNAILPAMTGGALGNDELAPGPIMIQGDHSRVSFRKMVVTPITKSAT